jgi:hypothetical protein
MGWPLNRHPNRDTNRRPDRGPNRLPVYAAFSTYHTLINQLLTMIRLIRCRATRGAFLERRIAGRMFMLMFGWLATAATLSAQQPDVHYEHQGVMPPGAIGSRQLERGGPLPGFYQPVEIKAPPGALISMAVENQFDQEQPAPRKAGLLIGAVYRLRITNIRMAEGVEVFPTIEVVDRLYAPTDQQSRFPIVVDIAEEDLKLAAAGKFVTRVIYLEDPRNALPAREDPKMQNWFEARPGQDPLAVADGLGRPVAILRMGARLPTQGDMQEEAFFIGSPPFVPYLPEKTSAPKANKPSAKTTRAPLSREKAVLGQNNLPRESLKAEKPQERITRQEYLQRESLQGEKPQERIQRQNYIPREPIKAEKPQEKILKQDFLLEESREKNVLREEVVEAGYFRDKAAGKNVLREETSNEKKPQERIARQKILRDEFLKAEKPQEGIVKEKIVRDEFPKAPISQEKAPREKILRDEFPKAAKPQEKVVKKILHREDVLKTETLQGRAQYENNRREEALKAGKLLAKIRKENVHREEVPKAGKYQDRAHYEILRREEALKAEKPQERAPKANILPPPPPEVSDPIPQNLPPPPEMMPEEAGVSDTQGHELLEPNERKAGS